MDQLRDTMIDRNVSVEELADEIGVSQDKVMRWLKYGDSPTLCELKDIADYLEVLIDELVYEDFDKIGEEDEVKTLDLCDMNICIEGIKYEVKIKADVKEVNPNE